MEHLTGETVAQRLGKGPVAPEQVLTVATETADALSAARRQDPIDRNQKPGNEMLIKGGAKLLNSGSARLKAHGALTVVAAPPDRSLNNQLIVTTVCCRDDSSSRLMRGTEDLRWIITASTRNGTALRRSP